MKKFIERHVDLKTWKGRIFFLLVGLFGAGLGALFGKLYLLYF